MTTVVDFVVAVVVILVASPLFENAIENLTGRLGKFLQRGRESAGGSPLDALGTVLPKSITTTIMLLSATFSIANARASDEIGVGIIVGAPLVLATVAMFAVGASALAYSGRRATGSTMNASGPAIGRDMGFFLVVFGLAVVVGLLGLPAWGNALVAVALGVAFIFHVVRAVRSAEAPEEESLRLILWRRPSEPPVWLMVVQLVGALVALVAAMEFFLAAVEGISAALALPLVVVALVIAPLVTELPEKVNLVGWIRDGKDTPALGSITNAMAFQATIPVAVGLLFTPWNLGGLPLLAAALALVSGGVIYLTVRGKGRISGRYLLAGGAFYAVFAVAAVVTAFGSG